MKNYWQRAKEIKRSLDKFVQQVAEARNIKDKLNLMLENEHRKGLAEECFNFLPTRVKLDLSGWADVDIFSHH